jgi:hypothetical protein
VSSKNSISSLPHALWKLNSKGKAAKSSNSCPLFLQNAFEITYFFWIWVRLLLTFGSIFDGSFCYYSFDDHCNSCSMNSGCDPASMKTLSLSLQESALGEHQILHLHTDLFLNHTNYGCPNSYVQGCCPICLQLYHTSTPCSCIPGTNS